WEVKRILYQTAKQGFVQSRYPVSGPVCERKGFLYEDCVRFFLVIDLIDQGECSIEDEGLGKCASEGPPQTAFMIPINDFRDSSVKAKTQTQRISAAIGHQRERIGKH